jgi:hypothetical protein
MLGDKREMDDCADTGRGTHFGDVGVASASRATCPATMGACQLDAITSALINKTGERRLSMFANCWNLRP